jgi:hypothetical protein
VPAWPVTESVRRSQFATKAITDAVANELDDAGQAVQEAMWRPVYRPVGAQ